MWQLLPLLPFPPPPDPNACPETCPKSQTPLREVSGSHTTLPAPSPAKQAPSLGCPRTRGSAGVSLGLLRRQSHRQCRHLRWLCPVQQGRAVPCPDALRPAPLARPAGKGSSSRKKQHGLVSQHCLGRCCTFPLYIMDSFCMRERKE